MYLWNEYKTFEGDKFYGSWVVVGIGVDFCSVAQCFALLLNRITTADKKHRLRLFCLALYFARQMCLKCVGFYLKI